MIESYIKAFIRVLFRVIILALIIYFIWADGSGIALRIAVSILVVVVALLLHENRILSVKQKFHEVDVVYRMNKLGEKKHE